MADLKTFSITDFIVIFGTLAFSGYSDGTYIEIAYNNPLWEHKSGAKGAVASVKTDRLDANVKIKLLQTSMDNDILSTYLLSDFVGNKPQPLFIKDLNGSTSFECSKCRVTKFPDTAYSTDPQDREWNIFCPQLIPFLGGNSI